MTHLVVLSGAGMSADSGLSTFRDSGGLWEDFDINEVATVDGWKKNPSKVLDFYNRRREEAAEAEPNEGHLAIASLEERYRVTVVTQNVDDLHERAGSNSVIHLHGELRKARSEKDPSLIRDIGADPIRLGETAEDGSQLRPHIVWFGEIVPMIEKASELVRGADLLVVIGTSLTVYPAAGLIHAAASDIPKYIVDPGQPDLPLSDEWEHIAERSAIGTPKLAEKLLNRQVR